MCNNSHETCRVLKELYYFQFQFYKMLVHT